jgi:2Fe-2S ferredoxin
VSKAVFILNDGSERAIEVARYESLMRAAVRNNVDGIAGECGGGLTCATCHVYVDPAWTDRLPPPGAGEEDMLQFTAAQRRPNSRLSCQLRMAHELAGIRVSVPESQY